MLKEAESKAAEKVIDRINFILKAGNQISLSKITDILGFTDDVITSHLQKLVGEKK